MAMGMKINNQTIPAPMDERGAYRWEPPPVLRTNGRGEDVAGPAARLVWIFPYMTLAEYTYWRSTVLAGAASARYTANTLLYDDLQTLKTITECVVHRPSYERIEGGNYINVTVIIDQIKTA